MSRNRNSNRGSDRLLGCLLGGVVGMLFSCCLGVAVLMLAENASKSAPPSSPGVQPGAYDIEAIVEEDYINRTMLESASGIPSPVPVVAGHLDLRPGGLADFAVQVEIGPFHPVIQGTLTLRATEAGEMEIGLVDARMGYIPVTPFVPADQFVAVNRSVNQQLATRAAATGSVLQVVGVTTDETTLRLYLVDVSE